MVDDGWLKVGAEIEEKDGGRDREDGWMDKVHLGPFVSKH